MSHFILGAVLFGLGLATPAWYRGLVRWHRTPRSGTMGLVAMLNGGCSAVWTLQTLLGFPLKMAGAELVPYLLLTYFGPLTLVVSLVIWMRQQHRQ